LLQQVQKVVDPIVTSPDRPTHKFPPDIKFPPDTRFLRVPGSHRRPAIRCCFLVLIMLEGETNGRRFHQAGARRRSLQAAAADVAAIGLTGKQIDIGQVLTGCSPAKTGAASCSADAAADRSPHAAAAAADRAAERQAVVRRDAAARRRSRPIPSLLPPLLIERLTGKPLSGVTPPASTSRARNRPLAVQKPSVQLSRRLALSSIRRRLVSWVRHSAWARSRPRPERCDARAGPYWRVRSDRRLRRVAEFRAHLVQRLARKPQ
jgi:hypothetical protein